MQLVYSSSVIEPILKTSHGTLAKPTGCPFRQVSPHNIILSPIDQIAFPLLFLYPNGERYPCPQKTAEEKKSLGYKSKLDEALDNSQSQRIFYSAIGRLGKQGLQQPSRLATGLLTN